MNKKSWQVCAGLCLLAMSTLACAQGPEVNEKPPMYST